MQLFILVYCALTDVNNHIVCFKNKEQILKSRSTKMNKCCRNCSLIHILMSPIEKKLGKMLSYWELCGYVNFRKSHISQKLNVLHNFTVLGCIS